MTNVVTIQRPQRWDTPFGADMTDGDVDHILALEPFSGMDPKSFVPSQSLAGIIKNDTRIVSFRDGDIIVRKGDYGNSAFLLLEGEARVVLNPDLPDEMLGRTIQKQKGLLESARQLWNKAPFPEVRTPKTERKKYLTGRRKNTKEVRIFLQDVPAILDKHGTVSFQAGVTFGEIAALARTRRTATIFAKGHAKLLEIRWQGFRELRKRDEGYRKHIDAKYRERSLRTHLQETPLFQHLDENTIANIANETLFETYGNFDWATSYKREAGSGSVEQVTREPIIVEEGDYPDGLLLIRSGFARVSQVMNHGHRTIEYIGKGKVFGLEELIHNWSKDNFLPLQTSLRALGYTDVLRVPTKIVEELVFPTLSKSTLTTLIPRHTVTSEEVKQDISRVDRIEPGMLEFLVERRFINGSATMLIDLDNCVRCDECVVACANAHNNNPRFNRHGPRYDHYMVANACMLCADPVCMIGCPTGAIHRSSAEGQVVINDESCIGCATCANSCPYDNIRMVDVREPNGTLIRDSSTGSRIPKATKCDLCIDQIGGPACERACPHNALTRADLSDLGSLADWIER